ncbi:MAG: VCBS repeat-containing protein, partial [Candidatus Saccharimonadales bacterium]
MLTTVVRQPVDALADIAAFYDYGSCQTRLHTFLSTGGNLDFQGEVGWWSSSDYCADKIIHTVSGDFDGNGISEIAVFNAVSPGETAIHVFKSDGSSFEFQGADGWWRSTGYTSTQVKHVLAGDFNKDGKDDLAAFYDYGNGATRIHVFLSTGSSFQYQGSNGWWRVDRGYNLTRTTGASIGYFNGDNYADLALFYDYGSGAARIHVWLSNGSSFRYQGSGGWWRVDKGYALARTTNIPASHFNLDRYSDLAMFYNYSNGAARIHVWLSNGSSFRYQGSNGWWKVDKGYSLSQVPFASASFHSPVYENRRGDIISVYDYPGNETRMHAL